jgi:hypothetical protein
VGFIYGIKYKFQGNVPTTYFLTSFLRQKSLLSKNAMSPFRSVAHVGGVGRGGWGMWAGTLGGWGIRRLWCTFAYRHVGTRIMLEKLEIIELQVIFNHVR